MTEARISHADIKGSSLERTAAMLFAAHGLPPWEREYTFHPTRKYRFDYAWPDHRVALEIQGGTYKVKKDGAKEQGAHSRGRRQRSDFEKCNAAVLLHWRLFYADTDMVTTGVIVDTLKEVLCPGRGRRSWPPSAE